MTDVRPHATPLEAAATAPKRSKKNKKRPRPPPTSEDYVKVIPLQVKEDKDSPMQLSKARKAKAMKVLPDGRTVTSVGGYRSVQSNRGAHVGTWYLEIAVAHLGTSGHCRLGVGTSGQDVEGPCGYTEASFGFRDVDGSKVTKGWREAYGEAYGEGDVVGVYLHLPEGGRPMEQKADIVRWKGRLYQTVTEPPEPARPLSGSVLGFTINGKWQGVAFQDILEGTYYAAGSLFTKPDPDAPASITFNFGPEFKHSPPQPEGLPPARPFCEVPPSSDYNTGVTDDASAGAGNATGGVGALQ